MDILVNEEILIERCQEYDYAAFEEVVDKFKDRIINICYSYTNNIEDSEDISQEVFVEVYKSIKDFKMQSSFSTWIYRIASNKSIDFLRKQKRLKRGSGLISYLEDQSLWNWTGNSNQYTDDKIIQQQRKEILYQAMAKLPSRQKEAYVLTQIEGFDHKATADILKTSIKSVESLVVRAKKKLRTILEKRIKEYL